MIELDEPLFFFYPEEVWDENKAALEEALLAYPPNKFNCIYEEDADLIPVK